MVLPGNALLVYLETSAQIVANENGKIEKRSMRLYEQGGAVDDT